MREALALARRELRSYFFSPVALIFLGTFLFVTLFTFFWVEAFFSRNVADIRPLFEWLPLLLVFLVGALTMRLWSEEHKLGTIELLLTLPVRVERLVLGKFLAGLALVALALALTIGLPLTVARMGDLDWGPVLGGYLGALLLASAFLALGLCVSSATDNQIVALIGTIGAGGLLHAVGSEPVTRFAGNELGELLRRIGTGSRFASIQRGVVDPLDLVYYASVTAFFLVLNVAILRSRKWSLGERSRRERQAWTAFVALAGANLLALNLWLAPAGLPRLDLTENREYSVSSTTRDLLRSLDSPLLIRGYFSAKTHPLLAPLVPRLRDLVREYGAISRGRVQAEFVDPKDSSSLEEEANQAYGIKSFPFRVADRYEAGIVNSYFSILVKYGDQYQVLGFDELIEVQATGERIDVRLRNPEYDLTRAVKKVVYGFQSIESVFADLKEPAQLDVYLTPKTLPENYRKLPETFEKVVRSLADRSGGKLKWKVTDPSETAGLPDELYRKYGIRPFAAALFSRDTFYAHVLLNVGGRAYQMVPGESTSEADVRKEIEGVLRRGTPGFLKRVGLVKPAPSQPNLPPQLAMRQPPPEDPTRTLREALGETYEVQDVSLESGRVPGDVDVLLLVGPKDYDEKARFAVDQYLMRGGTVVVLGGTYEMKMDTSPFGGGGLTVQKVKTGLEDLLAAWGLRVEESMVLDTRNEPFPIPVIRDLGVARVREIQLVRYPFFVDVRKDGMNDESPIVSGLPRVTLNWASPITTLSPKSDETAKRSVTTLLSSSPDSWTRSDTDIQPDFRRFPELGFAAPEGSRKPEALAVAVTGRFESAFASKPSPLFGGEPGETAAAVAASGAAAAPTTAEGDRTGRTIKLSPENARLVVVGSSSFVNDQVIGLSRQTSSEGAINGLRLVQNILDWAVADVDLLKIRARGSFARTLVTMDSGKRAFWEFLNYGIVVALLGAIVAGTVIARRRVKPIPLDPKPRTSRDDDFRPRDAREVTV